MKPTILFDQQIFRLQQYGGISRYFSKLINGLYHSDDFNILPNTYFSNNKHLDEQQVNKFSHLYKTRNFRGRRRLINYLINKNDRNLIRCIKEGMYDIFHPTYYQVDFLNHLPINKPFVLTVHDMIHEKMSALVFDYYNEVKNKAILIHKAEQIIAISENTKKDILHFYPEINPDKITVIYHGCSSVAHYQKPVNLAISKYILFVGNREAYKNFKWMFESISDFLKEKNMILVCAGGGSFSDSELELFKSFHLDKNVHFIDISNDIFLNDLYRNAFCFIYPSLYEGFGIPILESFTNNCPVILSKESCFPEIAGNAALYFEINKAESLVGQLTALFSNNDLRNELIKYSKVILLKYSWNKMVTEHMEVYKSILNK